MGYGNELAFDEEISAVGTREIRRKKVVWNYKIVLIITASGGVTSQMLHYQDYEAAETAYKELEEAPEVPSMQMTAIRLYKREEKYGRYGR